MSGLINDNFQPTQAATDSTFQEDARFERANPKKKLDSQGWSDAWDEATIFDEIYDNFRVSKLNYYDPNFEFTDAQKKSFVTDYTERESEMMQKATNQEQFLEYQNIINESRERTKRLGQYDPTSVMVAELALGLADPLSIGLGLATGGIATGVGTAMKLGKLGKTVLGATAGAIEGGTFGSIEYSMNPEKTTNDILMYTVFNAGLSSIAPILSKEGKHLSAKTTQEFDRAAVETVSKIDPELHTVPRDEFEVHYGGRKDVDVKAVREKVESHTKSLRDSIGEKPKSTSKKLKQRIDENIVKRNKIKAKEEAKAPSIRDKAESIIKSKSKINEKYDPQIKELNDKLEAAPSSRVYGKLSKELSDIQSKKDVELKKLSTRATKAKLPKESSDLKAINSELKNLRAELKAHEDYKAKVKEAKDFESLPLEDRIKLSNAEDFPNKPITDDYVPPVPKHASAAQNKALIGSPRITTTASEEIRVEAIPDVASDVTDNFTLLKGNNPLSKLGNSIYTHLTGSPVYTVKNLAVNLFENPQAAIKGGSIVNKTADIETAVVGHELRHWKGGQMVRNKSFRQYVKDNGKDRFMGGVRNLFDPAMRKQWNNDVMFGIHSSDYYNKLPKYMQDTVDTTAAQYARALELMQEAGIKGFENVKANKHYLPKILSADALDAALLKHPRELVEYVISKSYQTGGLSLSKKSSDMIAKRRIDQIMRSRHSISTDELPTTLEDLNLLSEELKKAGLDQRSIDDIISNKMDDVDEGNISDRAKKSLEPNIMFEHNGLGFSDLMNNDMDRLSERYIREASANIGLKRTIGVGSYRGMLRLLNDAHKLAANSSEVKLGKISAEDLNGQFMYMKDAVDVMYGRTIDTQRGLAKGLSRLRQATSLASLGGMGLTTAGELPRVLANHSATLFKKEVPLFAKPENLEKLGYHGLKQAEYILADSGFDHLFRPEFMRLDELEELSGATKSAWSKAASLLDSSLAKGQEIQAKFSLFNSVQGMGEKISTRATVWEVLNGAVPEQIARNAGWIRPDGSSLIEDLKPFIKKNERGKGNVFDMERLMTDRKDLLQDLQRGVMRIRNRDMLRMSVGETPMFLNNALGQALMQFRGFPYAALSKQVINDIRGDRSAAALTFFMSAGMGYMINAVRIGLSAMEDPDKDFNEMWKERMTGTALGFNMTSTMSQLAPLGLVSDLAATVGVMPPSLMADQSNNFQGGNSFMPPSLRFLDSARKVPQGVMEGDLHKSLYNLQKVAPMGNLIGIGDVTTKMINEFK